MSDVNHVVITARLTGDANARQAGNSTVFDFNVAVNHYDKKEGKEVGEFFTVKTWASSEKQASYYKEALKKGTAVVVEGRLSQEKWEKDGQKQSRVVILANGVALMGGKKGGSSNDEFPSDFPE